MVDAATKYKRLACHRGNTISYVDSLNDWDSASDSTLSKNGTSSILLSCVDAQLEMGLDRATGNTEEA